MGSMSAVRMMILVIAATGAVMAAAGSTDAAGREGAGLFREGSIRISVLFGSGTAFGEDYSIIGAGLGYYVRDNLELGLEGESWQGGGPGITRWSPQAQYVVPVGETIRPYAGLFYRRTIIEGYDDFNDAGVRAGALVLYGRTAYLGLGLVHERHLGCDRTVYEACSETYPELLVAIIF